jgi:hypothetical protein
LNSSPPPALVQRRRSSRELKAGEKEEGNGSEFTRGEKEKK